MVLRRSRGAVTNDACAVSVASVLRGRVQHAAWQLMMSARRTHPETTSALVLHVF